MCELISRRNEKEIGIYRYYFFCFEFLFFSLSYQETEDKIKITSHSSVDIFSFRFGNEEQDRNILKQLYSISDFSPSLSYPQDQT